MLFYFDLMKGSCVFVSTGKWFQRYELGSWNCASAAMAREYMERNWNCKLPDC